MGPPDGGSIPGDRVDLWYVSGQGTDSSVLLGRYRAILAPDEIARQARFARERDRRLFLVSRVLARTTLSRYAPVAPEAWRFAAGPLGRPEIAGPPGLPHLRFNVTHTPGLVACVVALSHDVGVDAERLDRRIAHGDLARRVLSRDEIQMLERLPEPARRAAFLDLWTLREAYIKARGAGVLRVPADALGFKLEPGGEPAVFFGAGWPDDPVRWRFFLLHPGRHSCAVAVRCPRPDSLELRARATTLPAGGGDD